MRRITFAEYQATVEKIEKINARAERRGFTGRLAIEAEKIVVTSTDDLGFTVEEIFYDVAITGDAPSYNGWTFVATLDWDAEAGLITRCAPGVEEIDRDGLRDGWCDHCKTNRQRVATYLVRNEAGEQRQVGSTCIKDFLGWTATPVFLSTAEVEDEIDHLLAGGRWAERRWSVDTILAVSWAAIQAYGFVPTSRAYDDTPTRDIVATVLDPNPRSKADRELVEKLRPYVARSADQARIVREWVLGDGFTGGGEYVHNLKAVAGAETAGMRNVGLLASAPQAWARAQERDLIRRQEQAELVNEFFGEPKQRLDLKVKIKSVRGIPTMYGTSALYTLIGTEGSAANHVFKWFSSAWALGETADDTVHTIRGTVKGFEDYNGKKTTVLTRCAVAK